MRHKATINQFTAECYTGGHPNWVSIYYNEVQIVSGLHHKEVQDLIACLERLRVSVVSTDNNPQIDKLAKEWGV